MKYSSVSIILPTYNGVQFIVNAIESVISQTFNNWELIIIDDGSTDKTGEIVLNLAQKDSRIKYLKNDKNLGIQKSLNRGLGEAKGEYIARIDDDDEWSGIDKLKKQIEFLNENLDYALVGTGVTVVDENNNKVTKYLLPEKDSDIREKILSKNCFAHSSVMFRKGVALKLGGYDESKEVLHVEDYDLWLRIGKVSKFFNLQFYGLKFMLRENAISSSNKIDQFKKDIDLVKKYKNNYPNFFRSLIFGYLRLYLYIFLKSFISKNFINKIFKFAKEM